MKLYLVNQLRIVPLKGLIALPLKIGMAVVIHMQDCCKNLSSTKDNVKEPKELGLSPLI